MLAYYRETPIIVFATTTTNGAFLLLLCHVPQTEFPPALSVCVSIHQEGDNGTASQAEPWVVWQVTGSSEGSFVEQRRETNDDDALNGATSGTSLSKLPAN